MTQLPVIKDGIFASVAHEFAGPSRDPYWMENTLTKIKINNPVMGEFLTGARKDFGEKALMTGLVVYEVLESQIEANQLNELFGE